MDEKKKQLLESAGIHVDEAMTRFMNNEGLLLKFLRRFPEDENFPRLRQALHAQNTAQAFEAAHTLKGVAGNLSMTALFRQLSQMTEDLRQGDLAAAQGKMPVLEEQYARLTTVLEGLD